MLTRAEEEELDDRLRNWGRWAADSEHSGTNIIYRMMLLSGEIKLSPLEQAKVDLVDALLVQRAWRSLPQNPPRYNTAKWVLAAHYAYPRLTVKRCCQGLHIRPREHEELLRLAKYMICQHAAKRLTVL